LQGLAIEQEALELLKQKGVTVIECDKATFRQRVMPQTEAFGKAHPDAKPVVDAIRST
jgi:TRAP-type C4-dicarboxylate transport system substrate-binding protein